LLFLLPVLARRRRSAGIEPGAVWVFTLVPRYPSAAAGTPSPTGEQ
jgi:hypothetical protein